MKKKQKKEILDFTGTATKLGRETIDSVIKVIEKQQKKVLVDTFRPERDEVINGLFFRILRFYHSFVLSFHFWAIDMAQVINRMVLESLYYLKFLTQEDKEELYLEFVKYGIGQEKLYKMHLVRLIDEGKISKTDELIDFIDSPTDEETWDELVNVKLKNFDDLHKLTGKIKSEDSYFLEYQLYSSTVHGHWSAIKKHYLRRCSEITHRFHYLGTTQLPPLSPRFLFELTELFYNSYLIWIETYGLEDEIKPILNKYLDGLENLLSRKKQTKS